MAEMSESDRGDSIPSGSETDGKGPACLSTIVRYFVWLEKYRCENATDTFYLYIVLSKFKEFAPCVILVFL